MKITKASGEEEKYSKGKFCNSLRDAGAPETLVDEVCAVVEKGLKPGISTTEIFRKASRYLARRNVGVSARYNLKRGMLELGPAGFLFEQFVEVVLETLGYRMKRNQIMQGRCISHEVDLTARKKDENFLLEVKYHNRPGIKEHVDTIMYADARCLDISARQPKERWKMWIFTNTKFTSSALKYGTCRNIKATGWDCPKGAGLEHIIAKHVLYPVTAIPSVNGFAREQFAKHNIMLVRDLAPHTPAYLTKHFDIKEKIAKKIIKEAHILVYGEEVE